MKYDGFWIQNSSSGIYKADKIATVYFFIFSRYFIHFLYAWRWISYFRNIITLHAEHLFIYIILLLVVTAGRAVSMRGVCATVPRTEVCPTDHATMLGHLREGEWAALAVLKVFGDRSRESGYCFRPTNMIARDRGARVYRAGLRHKWV